MMLQPGLQLAMELHRPITVQLTMELQQGLQLAMELHIPIKVQLTMELHSEIELLHVTKDLMEVHVELVVLGARELSITT